MIQILAALLLAAGLAAANGANDVSRAAATLVGGRVSCYRRALRWTLGWTLCGSLLSGVLALGVARRFEAAFSARPESVPLAVHAVLLGALAWICLATWKRLPVATTHAVLGSLVTLALVSGQRSQHSPAVFKALVIPLLASPVIAFECACTLRAGFSRWMREQSLDRAHWVSAGLIALSRGVNDSAKIWALILPLAEHAGLHAGTVAIYGQLAVAAGMCVGGMLGGRRVTEKLAYRIVPMGHLESVVANLTTALVIMAASVLTFPVASSHVITGAILGVGVAADRRSVQWRTLLEIVAAWFLTAPAAGLLTGILYMSGFPAVGVAVFAGVLYLGIVLLRPRLPKMAKQWVSGTQNAGPQGEIVLTSNDDARLSPMVRRFWPVLGSDQAEG